MRVAESAPWLMISVTRFDAVAGPPEPPPEVMVTVTTTFDPNGIVFVMVWLVMVAVVSVLTATACPLKILGVIWKPVPVMVVALMLNVPGSVAAIPIAPLATKAPRIVKSENDTKRVSE